MKVGLCTADWQADGLLLDGRVTTVRTVRVHVLCERADPFDLQWVVTESHVTAVTLTLLSRLLVKGYMNSEF